MAVIERKTKKARRSNSLLKSVLKVQSCSNNNTAAFPLELYTVCLTQTSPTRKSRKHSRSVHNASSSAWRWLLPALLFQVNTNSTRAVSFSRVTPPCSVPHSSNLQIWGAKAKMDFEDKAVDLFSPPFFFLLPTLTKVRFWTAGQLLKLQGQLQIKKTLEQIT